MARHQADSARRCSMICTFISQIPCVSVHMSHGKSQSVLNFQQRLLAGKRQLYVCASLNRTQANTSSMFGVRETHEFASRATGPWGSKKGEGLNHGRHFSGVVGVGSGTCECQVSFCRDDWAKHDIYPSMVRSCDSTPSS